MRSSDQRPSPNRDILALAIPAFATLIAEPLLLLADTWIVGHLGTPHLGGLTLASNVVHVVIGLSVFLAYTTTATVSRRLGAGDRAGALAGGVDGMVLGLALGVLVAALLAGGAPQLLALYGAAPDATALGASYLRIVGLGLPAQLVMLAATGVLRGLQDTRTPLRVVVVINLLNIVLNVTFVFGLQWGMTGAATGTAVSQWLGATVMGGIVVRAARREGVPLAWHPAGVLLAARMGGWLVVRNVSLQVALVLTTLAAASLGTAALAAHQVVGSIWTTLSFAMDAFAIAAQALVGLRLGAGDAPGARAILARVMAWGIGFGVLMGAGVALGRTPLAAVFSPDGAVQDAAAATLLVLLLVAPIGAVAFQLDGVLIGAGDARFLALAGIAATACYAPVVWWVWANGAGLVALWLAYAVWLTARGVILGLRTRSDVWLRLGAGAS